MENNRPLQAEEMLEKIFDFMNQLVDEKDFSATIMLLTEMGRTLVNSERASVWYWDRNKKQYWTMAALGSERIVVPEGSGIVGASIANKETIVINEPYKDVRFNPQVDKETGFVTKSILCMPIENARGQVIGAYQAINKLEEDGESVFGVQDVKYLTMAAVFCGKTLESHLLYTESQEDALTGLKNRRGFSEYFSDYVIPKLDEKTASLIMCDIDFFKKVNDTYGHNAGDAVLVHVAGILKDSVKDGGIVVRWGGEEFILMLLGCTESEAAACAEKIRTRVEASVCSFEGTDIKVTMSFGVKEFIKDMPLIQNIEGADARLYHAKTSGRNRVVTGEIV
ncbi:MAG: sensor domain-containing diguanylate cyclase [Lachnospiraceae bacterium]|nr:sensor domain-containing diguanylate cyclase [Lachnospiraceae bacterium]